MHPLNIETVFIFTKCPLCLFLFLGESDCALRLSDSWLLQKKIFFGQSRGNKGLNAGQINKGEEQRVVSGG